MAALFISGGSETDSTDCTGVHVVGVLLVGLSVGTKFCANMFGKFQLFSGQQEAGRQSARRAVMMREGIKPKHRIRDQPDDNQSRNTLEWERMVSTASTVFDCANESFNLRNVLILSTEVELEFANDRL